jgi:hypothetical protein
VRLAGDLEETIDLLKSNDEVATVSKSVIQTSLNTINNDETNDKYLILAVKNYISKGTAILGFYVSRTPIDTLLDGKSIWAEKNLAQI